MSEVGLHSLTSAKSFEELCRELLVAEGCENIRPTSNGPDQGQDTLVDVPTKGPLGTSLATWVVQCKFNSSGASVGEAAIGDVVGYLSLHRATGLLIITSSTFSGTAVTKANAIANDPRNPHQIVLWDGVEVMRRLRRFTHVTTKFWFRSGDTYQGKSRIDTFPLNSPTELALKFAIPAIFAESSVGDLAFDRAGSPTEQRLLDLAERYRSNVPIVVVLCGPTGAGKTVFASAIMNAFDAPRKAYVASYDLLDSYQRYVYAGDDRLHGILGFLLDADILVLDDIGARFPATHDARISLARFIEHLVRTRVKERRPTILIEPCERPATEIEPFLAWVGSEYGRYLCAMREKPPLPPNEKEVDADEGGSRPTCWLSKGWLGEKLERIEIELGRTSDFLLMPAEDFAATPIAIEGGGGVNAQVLHAAEQLRFEAAQLKRYREHVESLPWWAIRFEQAETVLELTPPGTDDDEFVLDD